MKRSAIKSRLLLLALPFLFTGCYTQFQTYDRFPMEKDRYSGYYSWDGFEEGKAAKTQQSQNQPSQEKVYEESEGEEVATNEELQLEMDEIYYIDYETKRWYEEHYANKLFWEGYREGYADGYYDGWNGYYPHSARFSLNRHRYLFGYTGAFEYFNFYHYPYYADSFWFGLGFMPGHSYYFDYYYGYNNYRYSPFNYYSYWGHPYYSFYNYGYAYNNYYRTTKYSRNTDLYRKGPRNSGLNNYTGTRTRNDVTSLDRRNSSANRSRSSSDLSRSRANTNATGVRSTGINSGITRSTSSNGSGVTRTRGTTSSVNKNNSGRSSSGTTRTRGSDSYLGRSTDIRSSSVGSDNRTYTIPSRKVETINRSSNRSRSNNGYFSVRDFFKAVQGAPSDRSSSRSWNVGSTNNSSRSQAVSRSSGTNRSSSVNRSSGSNTRSRSSSVSRSSSSSSSKSSSRSRSSSSSSKRSRGGN